MAKFFTGGLRIGDPTQPSSLERKFLNACRELQPTDDLYLVGDLVYGVSDLKFYDQLPPCRLHILAGLTEERIPDFVDEAFKRLPRYRNRLEVMSGFRFVEIGDATWRIAAQKRDLEGFSGILPAIYNEEGEFQISRSLTDGSTIVNVNFKIWEYRLAEEDSIKAFSRFTMKKAI